MKNTCFSFAMAGCLLAALPVNAHHAHAQYTMVLEELTGVMKEMRWMNPHVSFSLEVPDEQGVGRMWTVEGPSINQLIGDGWARDSMEPGDTITISCWPHRDGTRGCLMGYVVSINGVALEPSAPGAPGKEYD